MAAEVRRRARSMYAARAVRVGSQTIVLKQTAIKGDQPLPRRRHHGRRLPVCHGSSVQPLVTSAAAGGRYRRAAVRQRHASWYRHCCPTRHGILAGMSASDVCRHIPCDPSLSDAEDGPQIYGCACSASRGRFRPSSDPPPRSPLPLLVPLAAPRALPLAGAARRFVSRTVAPRCGLRCTARMAQCTVCCARAKG